MIHIDNSTGLPHFLYEKQGAEGEPLDVLVTRATFDMTNDGQSVTLAAEQTPIVFADRFEGPLEPHPFGAILAEEGDLVVFKPGTDVTVHGCARSPNNQPRPEWYARLTVGPISKVVKLSGPRQFRHSLLGWRLTHPRLVDHVRLDDRLAYGGCFDLPAPHAPDAPCCFPENPAGCGWLPARDELKALDKKNRKALKAQLAARRDWPVPQIEAPFNNQRKPGSGQYTNLTTRPRWSASRLARQGTFDEAWEKTRCPRLPTDFDTSFYQAAPADQVAQPWLVGDEVLTLEGLLPEARNTMRLPGWTVLLAAQAASGEHFVVQPVLDTLRIDLDKRQLVLLWRTHFRQDDPVIRLAMAVTDRPLTGVSERPDTIAATERRRAA